jgi:protein YIPF1/2
MRYASNCIPKLPPIQERIRRQQYLTTSLQGDLGHTDLQEDLEFHNSNFADTTPGTRKAPSSGLPPPVTASSGSGGSKRFLWTISFYAQFFDVDTSAVMSRCLAALYPRANFLDVLEGNPDLYGPFWIATTVVLILFLGGTISQYLASSGAGPFLYDFKLLSGASDSDPSSRFVPPPPAFDGSILADM